MTSFVFDIDVVGACNLRCPSCPHGNFEGFRLPRGFMEPELLTSILDKALAECCVEHVNLFSWCEPLLHPRLDELVRLVQERGIDCHLSSNLNLPVDFDRLMRANPAYFKISLSGFTQESYGYSHRGGDIERVKKQMVLLAEARRRQGATTRIAVNYHRYRHNLKDEPSMRRFAADLGFEFDPAWALLLPVEKMLAFPSGEAEGVSISDQDRELVAQLGLPLEAALSASRASGRGGCALRERQVSMDFRGEVQLCCGTFDSARFSVGNFLELPLNEIQARREAHPMCRRCMEAGAHLYLTYRTPGLERLVLETVAPNDSELLDLRGEFARQRRERRLRQLLKPLTALIGKKQRRALKSRIKRLVRLVQGAQNTPDPGERT
jgi:MoaA/NifB/PqqE/SkfB family radical SAM enzyme